MIWREQAACLNLPIELFFPLESKSFSYDDGKEVCKICPVKKDCLIDALETEISTNMYGLRGGLTPKYRQENRSKLREEYKITGRVNSGQFKPYRYNVG